MGLNTNPCHAETPKPLGVRPPFHANNVTSRKGVFLRLAIEPHLHFIELLPKFKQLGNGDLQCGSDIKDCF